LFQRITQTLQYTSPREGKINFEFPPPTLWRFLIVFGLHFLIMSLELYRMTKTKTKLERETANLMLGVTV